VGTPCERSWLAFMCCKYTVNVTKGTNDAFLNAMAWSLGVTCVHLAVCVVSVGGMGKRNGSRVHCFLKQHVWCFSEGLAYSPCYVHITLFCTCMSLWPPAWHGLAIPWVLCEVMTVRPLNLGAGTILGCHHLSRLPDEPCQVEVHQVFLWSCIAHYIVSSI
jgi:hypothetical protein